MPHVVTRSCCGDASCVFACPVNCIHPTPDEPDFGTAEMLYIDPASCVDCGACVSACPVGAIKPHTKLAEGELPFLEINELFHTPPRPRPVQAPLRPIERADPARGPLRVAVVGSGPAAMYAADEVLKQDGAQVSVIERLPTPYGLARAGVAPDHPDTRKVVDLFRTIERERGFSYHLGVEVGVDVTHEDLLAHHHAVLYATGASLDRRLGVEGEDLPGSGTATGFVAWYNGHPDHTELDVPLDAERVVVVGNGNVALDVARILATDPERLAGTDIADHALEALRESKVREVVLVARRGAAQAAYTLPELTGLVMRDDIDVVVEGGLRLDNETLRRRAAGTLEPMLEQKIRMLEHLPEPRGEGRRRVVLRFAQSPLRILGEGAVAGLEVVDNDLVVDAEGNARAVATERVSTLAAGLVLRSVGYRGRPVPGLPFDEVSATIPNDAGRVHDGSGTPVPGTYVAGWIKRGPSGYIGTNKTDAEETVAHLVADFNAGLLAEPSAPTAGASAGPDGEPGAHREAFAQLVRRRAPRSIDAAGWAAVDTYERAWGARDGRPRRKLVDRDTMVEVARARPVAPTPRHGARRARRRS
ncbi:FAD-dependent oxidoreductase [Nocardioides sp. ChNu-153]|uniref:FAD-dependent oxidoreductase n=1 Tax=unclassified Nocardioides TaxID=2615069 RepID=UPI00240712DF|nr:MULTISPECIES: FAD-dependent oxidoreductase [unclassified Nocardioides]MDF9715345.1 FAD-dependent oxidoreductase [Nocardioides sp. ChNu-99]MDN7121750.1 FAD-dependent oxidoreductase [Nocardioides sp. ChNu-153]